MLSEDKGIPPMTTARIQRFAILLSVYNFLLQYCPGNKNGNANFMSCFPSTDPNNDESRIRNYVYLPELIQSPMTAKEIEQYSKHDLSIVKVIQYIKNSWPSKMEEQFKPYVRCKYELSIENSGLHWVNRVVIPHQLPHQDITQIISQSSRNMSYEIASMIVHMVAINGQDNRKLGQKL